LPTYDWGNFIYANDSSGMAYNNVNNELWVALAEKAYAQINESGWIGQDNTNTYDGIGFGWSALSLRQITGLNAGGNAMTTQISLPFFTYTIVHVNDMMAAFNAGRMVTVNSKDSGVGPGVVANHSYILTGYNSVTGKYKLYNPWGGTDGEVELTYSQLANNFSGWDATV
jgi:Calpain family cysteine protease